MKLLHATLYQDLVIKIYILTYHGSDICNNFPLGRGTNVFQLCLVRFPQPVYGIHNGRSHIQGHVEVLYNGQWGTICDDAFDENHYGALVMCRMMGYEDGDESDFYRQSYVIPSTRIWLDDVRCTGNETNIADCLHREPWGDHNCDHNEDVAIRCNSK